MALALPGNSPIVGGEKPSLAWMHWFTRINVFANAFIDASATYDPGSLADGAGETSSAITVTGAAFGDFVLVAAPYDLAGVIATAYVSAANTVRIRLQNETGGVVDLASGSWKLRVLKAT